MDNWMELQRFYNEFRKATFEDENLQDFGFTSADGKHHIFMYKTNEYSDDGTFEWYIEMNEVVDGAHEPTDVTFSPIDDDACLMIQIAWCIEKFF